MTAEPALEILDEKDAKLFMQIEDWRPRSGDSVTLWMRTCEICGSKHPYCSDLQLALRELRNQDPEFGRYREPTPEPAPEPTESELLAAHGIARIEHSGATLQVDPETRAELSGLSLAELKKRAVVDRWNRLKASGRDIQIAEENMP